MKTGIHRRSFFQRMLTALGVAAVAPVAPKVVYAEPSFSQYTKENHAIVEEFSTPRSTEAWWYRIAPPIRYKDKGSSQYVLNKTYIIRDRDWVVVFHILALVSDIMSSSS